MGELEGPEARQETSGQKEDTVQDEEALEPVELVELVTNLVVVWAWLTIFFRAHVTEKTAH